MGADVYLQSVSNRCREEWEPKFKAAVTKRDKHPRGSAKEIEAQKLVDEAYSAMYAKGYFRDCYNSYGLFAQTELSWWRDVVPMLDEESLLPIDRARELRNLVAEATIDTTKAEDVAHKQNDDAPPEGWQAYYEKDRQELLALIDQSIELNEPLYCSL